MKVLLLVSAVALLVGPAHIQASDVNFKKLNAIYDQAEQCSNSLTEDVFVEDVSNLTQGKGGCGDKFFCKVQQILLDKPENFCGNKEVLVKTVQMYNRHAQCGDKIQGVTTNVEVQLSRLLDHVLRCVRRRNLNRP